MQAHVITDGLLLIGAWRGHAALSFTSSGDPGPSRMRWAFGALTVQEYKKLKGHSRPGAWAHRGVGQLVQRRVQLRQRVAQVLHHHVKVLHVQALLADEVRVHVRHGGRQALRAPAKGQRQEVHLRAGLQLLSGVGEAPTLAGCVSSAADERGRLCRHSGLFWAVQDAAAALPLVPGELGPSGRPCTTNK